MTLACLPSRVIVVGLTGVGGGSIMTPLLITVFGVPAPIAGVKLLA